MKHVRLDQTPEAPVSHNPDIKKRVLLRPGDLPGLTNFSQARFRPQQVAAGHSHPDMVEVFWVEAGQGMITIDGDSYDLSPGTCVAVEPGECHEVINSGTVDLVLTYFGLQL